MIFFLLYTFLSSECFALRTGNVRSFLKTMLLPLQEKKMPSQAVSSELATGVMFVVGMGAPVRKEAAEPKGGPGRPPRV